MFNANNLLTLLKTRPFAPFRLVLSDGGTVEVRSPEFAMPARQFVVVGIPDPAAAETFIDRWTTVWYMHVTRVEQIHPGAALHVASRSGGIASAISHLTRLMGRRQAHCRRKRRPRPAAPA